MRSHNAADAAFKPLDGGQLWFAAVVLAAANFFAILDMTIANVSVPSIAGGLAASTSQGTWVITSYAVAEAITVPLTGWLAARFGAVRVFVCAMALFGACSALCGIAHSLGFLVLARVLQGLAGGPLMPLSQTLLLRIFPKEKAAAANALWAMTTLVAPVVGPILGGWICDNYNWSWIFFINVPVAIGCSVVAWNLLKRYELPVERAPIDRVGLIILIVWVGALQLMLDEGKDLDWFSSSIIVALGIVALIGFFAFLIWELTDDHPIVDLTVFRYRGFSAAALTMSLAFAAFFAANVLTPLWLQSFMGYTATSAGQTTAWSGVTALLCGPLAAALVARVDPRRIAFCAIAWLGVITLWRSVATTDMTNWNVSLPLLFMGLGMPFFFISLNGLALASVDERETASAAGLLNFVRTLSGAFATSLVNTAWEDEIKVNHAELVGLTDGDGRLDAVLSAGGMTPEGINTTLDHLLTSQSVMLATNRIMLLIGVAFIVAAFAIWLAPKPTRAVEASGGH